MGVAVSRLRFLVFAPLLLLQGCWFVFIPGSLVQAAADGITGAEGNHCVNERAKVGDYINLTDGTRWKVESLSGTSTRCQHPAHPIRARLSPA